MGLIVHIVSESTGDTAATLVRAVGVQYMSEEIFLRRHYDVRNEAKVDMVLRQVGREGGLIVFTMVHRDLANYLMRQCYLKDIPAVDLLGPMLEAFVKFFGRMAEVKMGIYHSVSENYFRRIQAIEYTLNHDDGTNLATLQEADIILVGVSRTSKTPVSMYLAVEHGMKVANVALAKGVEPPEHISKVAQNKIVALTIQPQRLVEIRRARLGKISHEHRLIYAQEEYVMEELVISEEYFRRHPRWPVIDVTKRSIEETATLILDKVYGKVRPIQIKSK